MRQIVLGMAAIGAIAVGAACSAGGSNGPPSPEASGESSSPGPGDGLLDLTPPASSPPLSGGNGGVPPGIVDRIVVDAAGAAGVGVEEVAVISADAVTWGDGSLGCPEPGMLYAQVLVNGYHVIVEAGGQQRDYRVTGSGAFRLCG